MEGKRKRAVALLAVGLMLAFAGCGSQEPQQTQELGVAVEVQEATVGVMESYVRASSKVTAGNEISVVPKTTGKVKSVNVKVGDKVTKGQVLFTMDTSDLESQRKQAQAGVDQAKAAVDAAKANYQTNVEGTLKNQLNQLKSAMDTAKLQADAAAQTLAESQKLYEAGQITKQQLAEAQAKAQSANAQYEAAKESYQVTKDKIYGGTASASQAGIAQAQAGLDAANAQLQAVEDTIASASVKAEISGTISSCNITAGAMASQTNPAMTIVGLEQAKFTFQVSDKVINQVQVGNKAYIQVDGAGDAVLEGTVSMVSPAANAQTLLYPVEIVVDNPEQNMKPGMFASVKMVTSQKEGVISLPLDAVMEKEGETFVYVVGEDSHAQKVVVTTGIQNDTQVEITGGLEAGAQVVVKGQDYLADGSLVQPV